MNKDQVSGKVDQAVGKVKQGVGEAVGDQNLANKGVLDQAKGVVKETLGRRQRRRQAGASFQREGRCRAGQPKPRQN